MVIAYDAIYLRTDFVAVPSLGRSNLVFNIKKGSVKMN